MTDPANPAVHSPGAPVAYPATPPPPAIAALPPLTPRPRWQRALAGQTVYVTGATSGLGLAVAQQLSANGAHVAILGRKQLPEVLAVVQRHARDAHQQFTAHHLDVTDRTQVMATLNALATQWRAPTHVLHAAGVPGGYPFTHAEAFEQFDRVIQTNLYGAHHVISAVLPHLMTARGRLVLVGSMAGFVGCYGYTAYGASKFGLFGLAESLRYELAPTGVSLGVLAPPEFPSPLLTEEYKTIHPATRVLKRFSGEQTLEQVTYAAMDMLSHRQYLSVPGWMAKLLRLQMRLLPLDWAHAVADWQVQRALRGARRG